MGLQSRLPLGLGTPLMAGRKLEGRGVRDRVATALSSVASFPQVCLFFQNQLFRGNRTTKVDARRFAAFCSPNLPPLATVGADVTGKPCKSRARWLPSAGAGQGVATRGSWLGLSRI